MEKKEIATFEEGTPTNKEYKGNQVFKLGNGNCYVEVGRTRLDVTDRQFEKIGTAKKIEDEKRAEQTRIQDKAVAEQRKAEENLRA